MVQFPNTGNLSPVSESSTHLSAPLTAAGAVKLEIEDPTEEEHGPLNKRLKIGGPFSQQWGTGDSMVPSQSDQYNPLDGPSPLGLSLRKSPSLLDLIQMRLSQGNNAISGFTNGGLESGKKKDLKPATTAASAAVDKLKASNFPASLLRIGSWERVSRYEGDLVAKCYFAKHKLVWEVLDGGLKSKIEIQWSDITALKASCPENGPGTLDIVLARQPLFFRETNPQPRKHTLWQATSDITGGQASMHRNHFLQCPQGLLNKHFEKLIQCDPRLNLLSQQPEVILESPYFETRCSVFEEQHESKCHEFGVKGECVSTFPGFQDTMSSQAALSTLCSSEVQDPLRRTPDPVSQETPSPSSVMDSRVIEETTCSEAEELKEPNQWNSLEVPPVLHGSLSVSELMDQIGHCLSDQRNLEDPLFSVMGQSRDDLMQELNQYLLSDNQQLSASDEKSLMSRVNSLCSLLQKDPSSQNLLQMRKAGPSETDGDQDPEQASEIRPPQPISRKDSLGDLLLHLPRIASLPHFLHNIYEEDC
ncbi:hypothetical protein QJS04_geneDACA003885 [Acorus gramineus]|uniref:TRF2/HOY1 PH-like domain-containing protein n=1 Tax=Acorus gramineus TaxID=55184 RepID=A0AAV9BKD1_ACOGR|nr:hypothetical protein QJS04_geneDACA003885 [Acorus gramineus]